MTLKQFLGVVFVLVFLCSGVLMSQVFAADPTPTSILGGTIDPGVKILREGSAIGFFNIILKIVYITAGIYVFFNFIVAGFRFLAASDKPETITQVKDIILKSLIGLLIIVLSVVFAALIGWLFYDSPTAILAPQLQIEEEDPCGGCIGSYSTCSFGTGGTGGCQAQYGHPCTPCDSSCGSGQYKCVP